MRKKERGGSFAEDNRATVYFVEDKEWLYIFADNYPYKAPGMELVGGRRLVNSIHFHIPTKNFQFKGH